MSQTRNVFRILPLLLLILPCPIRADEENLVYFHKQILNRQDAMQFRLDPNATICRVVVKEKEGLAELYVVIQIYLIRELLNDIGPKKVNMIFQSVPAGGWKMLYTVAKGHEKRIYWEIPVARGPGETYLWPLIDFTERPPTGFNVIILGFAEIEDEASKYNEKMILDMNTAFEFKMPFEKQWMRLNAYHVKNMQNFNLDGKYLFEHLRERIIIYQNTTKKGVVREDVLEKMIDFDLDMIVWENVEPGLHRTTTMVPTVESQGRRNAMRSSVAFVLMLMSILFRSKLK